jgi:hypothetical protein
MKFITALNCMDGRTIKPILKYFQKKLNIDDLYIDMITEPGMDGFLKNKENIYKLEQKIRISLINHDSDYIIIAGHYDCAGNPVSDEQHKNDIINSVNLLYSFLFEKQFFNKDKLNLIGVYINKDFEIEEIVEIDIK